MNRQQLFTLAKLMRVDDNCDLDKVYEILTRSHKILSISHGSAHQLTRQLSDLIAETNAENSHKRSR